MEEQRCGLIHDLKGLLLGAEVEVGKQLTRLLSQSLRGEMVAWAGVLE